MGWLAGLHHRVGRWPRWVRVGWWVLALPVALAAWAAAGQGARRGLGLVGAGVAALVWIGLATDTTAGPEDDDQVVASSRTSGPTVPPAASTTTTNNATPTTAATATTAVPPPNGPGGSVAGDEDAVAAAIGDLLQVLDGLVGGSLGAPVAYVRFDYDGDGWADTDGDCRSTRHELLAARSETPVVHSPDGCRVVTGTWVDPYTGTTYDDADDVSIDHVVGLSWAHEAGAWAWDAATKAAFANDIDSPVLAVVGRATNGAKGGAGPEGWRPPDPGAWCGYAIDVITIAARWELTVPPDAGTALADMVDTCTRLDDLALEINAANPTATTAPTSTTRAPAPTTTTAAPPPVTAAPPPPPPAPAPAPACDRSYPSVCIPPYPPDLNCGDISQRRFVVEGSDPHGFDGDDDGVGCES